MVVRDLKNLIRNASDSKEVILTRVSENKFLISIESRWEYLELSN